MLMLSQHISFQTKLGTLQQDQNKFSLKESLKIYD